MDRDVLFRGFSKELNKFVYGCGVYENKGKWIVSVSFNSESSLPSIESFRVIDESIGQFTGLTDKNDVKIFEGDIVKVPTEWNSLVGAVEYNKNIASFDAWPKNRSEGCFLITDENIEVIGNVFENSFNNIKS